MFFIGYNLTSASIKIIAWEYIAHKHFQKHLCHEKN